MGLKKKTTKNGSGTFLSGRLQRVPIDAISSDWLPIKCGVPQGSLLGPILFSLYINDHPSVLETVKYVAHKEVVIQSPSASLPIVEYCSVVWDPSTATLKAKLEGVQNF